MLIHREAVPELFIAYSYEASFSRRPTGVQNINHLRSHWFFFNWQDRSTLYSSHLQRLNYRFLYVWWKFKRQDKTNDGKPEIYKSWLCLIFLYTSIHETCSVNLRHMFWNKTRNQNPAHPENPLCCGFWLYLLSDMAGFVQQEWLYLVITLAYITKNYICLV